MITETRAGVPMDTRALVNYLGHLVDRFFKILPLWEAKEETLPVYIQSLQAELIGCQEFVLAVQNDALLVRLASVLQYLIDHPELDPGTVKREVFGSISVCNQLKIKYATKEGGVVR